MTIALNEDFPTLICAHSFDYEVLKTTAPTVSNDKQHPLRNIVLRRLLRLSLRLSSENSDDSKALIGNAKFIRDVVIDLGRSQRTLLERERSGYGDLPEDWELTERAEALFELLPKLDEILRTLFEHSPITRHPFDCSLGSLYVPGISGEEILGPVSNMKPLRVFSTINPMVTFLQLNTSWAGNVLSLCDRTKLKAFGFHWEWRTGCNEPGMFSELITTLSKFKFLSDLHTLHPYAELPAPVDCSCCSELRFTVRRLHESEENEALTGGFLSGLPGSCRVGIGRNSIWERKKRWKGCDMDEFVVQKLHKAEVPVFYDAGSCLAFTCLEEDGYDECPTTKDVLEILPELL